MNIFFIWLFCLGSPALAGATPVTPKPEMFAFGSPLELQGNSPFNYCALPLDIYQSTSRQDLGDLRVFNGRDQVVPHLLKRGLPTTARPPERWRAELPFFPLSGPAARNSADLNLHVEQSSATTIIDLKTSGTATAPPQELSGYLIDTAPLTSQRPRPKGGLDRWTSAALELEWSAPQNDFMDRIVLETSADLLVWQPLTTATLVRMNHQGYRLERNKITLPGQLRRYLRLIWPQGQVPVILTRVLMLADTTARAEPPKLSWLSAKIQAAPKDPRLFMVDLGGALPVERFRVKLPERNGMTVATVSSAATQAGPYTQEWQGLLYHLVADGEEIHNPEIALRPVPHRYWQISLATSEAGLVSPPEISCGWRPGQLYFLAQGEGPFRVLYGNGTIQPTDFKMDNLLSRYQGTGNAVLTPTLAKVGPRFVQNAKIKLQIQAAPRPYRKYVLWLVLGFGVGLIGWMTCHLYRQLQAAGTNTKGG